MPTKPAMSACQANQYAFTVTLNPSKYRLEPERQYDLYAESLYEHLRVKSDVLLTYVVELTPHAMNMHYHGIVSFKEPHNLLQARKWLSNKVRNDPVFGAQTRMKLIEDQGWLEYMSKSLTETQELLDRRPIIVDELDLFPKGFDKYAIQL